MKYMLDTNILIYLIKNKPPIVASHIDALDAQDQLCMSFVTYAELLKGAERSTSKDKVLLNLRRLVCQIPVLYQTYKALCKHYATQATQLKKAGTPIGGNDLWIASHALAENATLVTHNTREFDRITGLVLVDWTKPPG